MNLLVKLQKTLPQISRIKKQVIARKFNAIIENYPYILFFHCNSVNWNAVQKEIWQQKINCPGFFVPSNLYPIIAKINSSLEHVENSTGTPYLDTHSFKHMHLDKSLYTNNNTQLEKRRLLTAATTLIVACEDIKQLAAIMEKCAPPAFFCLGGLYEKNACSHMDFRILLSAAENKAAYTLTSTLSMTPVSLLNVFCVMHSLVHHLSLLPHLEKEDQRVMEQSGMSCNPSFA